VESEFSYLEVLRYEESDRSTSRCPLGGERLELLGNNRDDDDDDDDDIDIEDG